MATLSTTSTFNSTRTTVLSSVIEARNIAQACEYVKELRYKLRMFSMPVKPALNYGDNQSVLANTTMPEPMSKKKSNAMAYHFIREGCAQNALKTAYVNTNDNVADLMTKQLSRRNVGSL